MGPKLTKFQFFGLVGIEMEKSHSLQNFSSRRHLWGVWGLSKVKSPKTTSSRDIKRKVISTQENVGFPKFFLRFRAAFTKPENMAGVPWPIFSYDAPYSRASLDHLAAFETFRNALKASGAQRCEYNWKAHYPTCTNHSIWPMYTKILWKRI